MNDRSRLRPSDDGTGISLSVIDGIEELRGLVPAWRDLLVATPGSCAYQSPEWMLGWYDEAGRRDRLHVLAFHHGDELVCIAPFVVTRPLGAPPIEVVITAATEPGDYGDPLFASEHAEACAALLTDHLRDLARSSGCAVAVRRVDEQSVFYRTLLEIDDVEVVETSSAASPVTRFDAWDDPEGEIERRAAKLKLPKYSRKLASSLGEVTIETTAPVTPGLERMAEMHIERFGAEDAPRLLQRPRSLALVRDSMEALDRVGDARMCRLVAGETVAALELGHNIGSRWVGQAAGFDTVAGKCRPGYVLVHGILLQALAEGAAEYDHGQGVQDYKTVWSNELRTLRSVVLTRPGALGRAERFMQHGVASRRARSLLAGPVKSGSTPR
ncbi:MAG: GNAT family N-acetyltransferase [Acidimicrobiia bacterium]|nr:GNAT family N-acetyltransferase [Acidimicrobiia bacterium]